MLDPSRLTDSFFPFKFLHFVCGKSQTPLFLVPSAYRRPYNASFKEEMRLTTPTFLQVFYMNDSKYDHHN